MSAVLAPLPQHLAERVADAEARLDEAEAILTSPQRAKDQKIRATIELRDAHIEAARTLADAESNLNVAAIEVRAAYGLIHSTLPAALEAIEKARIIRKVYDGALARARNLGIDIPPEIVVPRAAASGRSSDKVLGARLRETISDRGMDW